MNTLAAIGWPVVPDIFGISPHGIGIAVGYGIGTAWLARRAERIGVKADHVWNFMTWAVIGVIVGARAFYVAGHWDDIVGRGGLIEIVKLTNGGVVLYGGIFGALAVVYPYIRKHGLPFVRLFDQAAAPLALGIAIGRIGDLVIGDHLGGRTDFFLGFRYEGGIGCPPAACLPDRILEIGAVVHQTALYDFLNALLLLPVLLVIGRRPRPRGFLITFAATWYATGRLISDFARTTTETYFGLRGTQWVSVVLIVIGVTSLIRIALRGERDEDEPQAAEPAPAEGAHPPTDARTDAPS